MQNQISQLQSSAIDSPNNEGENFNPNNISQSIDFIDINAIPDFDKYYNSGVENLVTAQFNYDAIGNLETRVRMWDVLDRKENFGKFYSSSPENYRKTANLISDEILINTNNIRLEYYLNSNISTDINGKLINNITEIYFRDFSISYENYDDTNFGITMGNDITIQGLNNIAIGSNFSIIILACFKCFRVLLIETASFSQMFETFRFNFSRLNAFSNTSKLFDSLS